MIRFFSCGCETTVSAPAAFRSIALICDTPSTVGTENCGTLTETLPWATLLFIQLCLGLKHNERQITKGFLFELCCCVRVCLICKAELVEPPAIIMNINNKLGASLGICFYWWLMMGSAPRLKLGSGFYQFLGSGNSWLCCQGAEWQHGWGVYLLSELKVCCLSPAEV